MLDLALKAKIPLVSVDTDDLLNFKEILEFYHGRAILEWRALKTTIIRNAVYYYLTPLNDVESIYERFSEKRSTLICINHDNNALILNAGALIVPKELVKEHLRDSGHDEELANALSGLSLYKVAEIVALALALSEDSVTSEVILDVKKRYNNPIKGLLQVDLNYDFYMPNEDLESWSRINKKFFLDCDTQQLVPKGLVFDGPSGTGKSQGAKYIARCFGVPLYLLDMSNILNMYVGQSEAAMRAALSRVDAEAPCILLLDEVEKLFRKKEEDNVGSNLLGQLLWWLQERKSKVLVVMTTNDITSLPEELYRPGRIDKILYFPNITSKILLNTFISRVYKELNSRPKKYTELVSLTDEVNISYSKARQLVIDDIKKNWVE